ncbi:MAG: MFS transporter [Euryarchaeota archaeon]|jgi:PAT family beta-lactamase induction signal transducer AmpG|nr:MFS transporter [Euryarchaeota archaeon]
MVVIENKRGLKYFLFGSLYFSEGLMVAITTVATSLYLREKAISIPVTTLIVGIVNIPWMLKFVWGPVIDYFRRFGRKLFIMLGGALTIFCMFLVSFVDPRASLLPFTLLIFLSHVGIGFIDVSTDAWAIDVSTDKDRGKINGSMFAGQYTAWAIGAALFPLIGSQYGYHFVYLINALLILFILLFPFVVKEIVKEKVKEKIVSLVVKEFKTKTVLLIALFSPLVFMNEGIMSFIVPIYMRDGLGLSDVQIGFIAMILPVFLAVGSLVGGVVTDKIGRKSALYLFIGFNVVCTAFLIFADSWWKLSIIYGMIGFFMGGHSTVSCALFMDVTNPRIGATQYGIFTGIANVGLNGAGMITGTLAIILGFSRTFLYAAWVFGPALLVLYFIRIKKHDRGF